MDVRNDWVSGKLEQLRLCTMTFVEGERAAPDNPSAQQQRDSEQPTPGGIGGRCRFLDERHRRQTNVLIRRALRWQEERTGGDFSKLTEEDLVARSLMLELTVANMLCGGDGRVSNGAVRNLITMEAQASAETRTVSVPTEQRSESLRATPLV